MGHAGNLSNFSALVDVCLEPTYVSHHVEVGSGPPKAKEAISEWTSFRNLTPADSADQQGLRHGIVLVPAVTSPRQGAAVVMSTILAEVT